MHWGKTGSLKHPRYHHNLVLLDDGSVLCFGGERGYRKVVTHAERWDMVTGLWSIVELPEISTPEKIIPPDLGYSRRQTAAVRLKDGMLLVSGGVEEMSTWDGDDKEYLVSDAVIVDPSELTVQAFAGNLVERRKNHAAIILADGRVLICGGATEDSNKVLSSAEVWFPDANYDTAICAKRGELAFNAKKYPEAVIILKETVNSAYCDPGSKIRYALALMNMHSPEYSEEELFSACGEVLDLKENDEPWSTKLFGQMLSFIGKDNYNRMLEWYCHKVFDRHRLHRPATKKDKWSHLYTLREALNFALHKESAADAFLIKAYKSYGDVTTDIGEFAAYLSARSGGDDAFDLLKEQSDKSDVNIFSLNNLAGQYIRRKNIEQADKTLDRVEKLLKDRDVPVDDDEKLLYVCDEYFYTGNRANCLWGQGKFKEGIPIARRAFELENELRERTKFADPFTGGDRYVEEHVYSTGSWALISMLADAGEITEARKIFEALLDDADVMQARLDGHRENAELMIVGGLCAYKSPEKDIKLVLPGSRVWNRIVKFIPLPSTGNLCIWYAYLHIVKGNKKEAFKFIKQSLKQGYPAKSIAEDPDFVPFYNDPVFRKLVGIKNKN